MVKGITVEQRREYKNTLLEEYYGLLPDKIKSNYHYENFILDFRACATRSMLSAVTKFGPIFKDDFSYDAADNLSNRVIEAVRDLKPIEAIQDLKSKKEF